MKRFVAMILTVAMMVSCFAMTSFAQVEKYKDKKAKLTIYVDTSCFEPGADPDSFGRGDVVGIANMATSQTAKYVWVAPDDAGNPNRGMTASIDSAEVRSPSSVLKVGDKVKVELEVSIYGSYRDGTVEYEWIPGDSKSVSVHATGSGGPKIETTTSRKSGSTYTVTFTTRAVSGYYDAPEDLQWSGSSSLGQAKWVKPESGNSGGAYDIRLRRDGKTVCEFSCVSGYTMNFYPWMEREGDYTFEVRSVPSGNVSGAKRSDWAESDSQYVDEKHISDGTGKFDPSGTGSSEDPGSGISGNTNQVGWIKSGSAWYYRYPDGTYRKNGWEKVSGKWYYFDASGAMKTGWITVSGQTYYLDNTNGDMKTGWVKTSDGQWYYLNPDPNSSIQGAMLKNQWADINGRTYYFGASGAMTTGWLKIGEKFYYFNPAQNAELGALVRNQRIDSFYVGADGAWERGK